jgi:FHS family L-fucose permease-like MFS transporter
MEKTAKTDLKALSVLTTLFFMWGFITVMNDILIPYLKGVFQLSHTEAMLVQFAFFGAYFVGSLIYFIISIKTGDPINRFGYKNGLLAGLLVSAIGTALFYPAAEFSSYPFFLSALFILGLGFTLLQIAANPYVAIIGPSETASGRLNLSQGFNSLGTTLAPIVGGFLIFTYFSVQSGSADSVKTPYLIFSALFLLLALMIKFSHLPSVSVTESKAKGAGALKHKSLQLGILAIFMYVGGEVCIGSILISYLGLPEIAGLAKEQAGTYVAFYWGGLMIGRFLGAISLSEMNASKKNLLSILAPLAAFAIICYFKGIEIAGIYSIFLVLNAICFRLGNSNPARALFIFSLAAAALVATSMANIGSAAMWSIIGVGLFNSIMWSNIFTLSIDGLGEYAAQGSSLLVMAILGGALLPLLQGFLADNIGIRLSFIVPFCSYLYIAFYGLKGYKIGRKDLI